MIHILISGGIDSFVMARMIKSDCSDQLEAIWIDYGQPCKDQEWTAACFCSLQLGIPLKRVEIRDIDARPLKIGAERNGPRVIAGRNRRFIEAASKGADSVAIGCILDDFHFYEDCRRDYLDALEKEMGISILTPLIMLSKKEIVKLGADLPLQMTWSCYQTSSRDQCGECNSCRERRQAMRYG